MMYFKRLFRSGQVSIPKEFQKQLNINEGHYLFIYHCNNSIVIEKDHHNKTLNQCIFRKGIYSYRNKEFDGDSSRKFFKNTNKTG